MTEPISSRCAIRKHLSERIHLIAEAARFGTLLSAAVQWCERITLCLSAPRSERGTVDAWSDLLAARSKYDRVIVHDVEATEGWLLHRLHETSILRLIQACSRRFDDQLLCFERGGHVQMFLARAPLTRAAFRVDGGAVVHFQGESTEELALSFQGLVDRWREASRVPTGSELDALTTSVRPRVTEQPRADVTPLTVVTEHDALRQAIAKLFGLDLHATESEPSRSSGKATLGGYPSRACPTE